MHRGSFAVTVVAGLVSWSAIASAQASPPSGQPTNPDATPKAAPAKGHGHKKSQDAAAPSDTPKPSDTPPPTDAAPSGGAPTPPDAGSPAPASSSEPSATPPAATVPSLTGGDVAPSDLSATTTTRASATPAVTPRPIGIYPRSDAQVAPAPNALAPIPARPSTEDVFAEDWWEHARPVFEIHGYFRTRAELFHNFSLGRLDAPSNAIWPQPSDNTYTTINKGTIGPSLCTSKEAGQGNDDNPADGLVGCRNKTQAGANLRFRLDPELHISDNLRVISQIDLLDNVVLGSTPSGYAFQPAAGGGYQTTSPNGYYYNGVLDDTIVSPNSGVNSLQNSVQVKRVWAEYATPVGTLRFGRMPDHFGLGIVHNAGDGYDDDFQTTIDRLQFITAIKPLDLYVGGSWDFPNEGAIIPASLPGGQPYDASQLDDVNQWSLLIMRKQSPELVKTALSHDQLVLNGGLYLTLRKQLLADDPPTSGTSANVPDQSSPQAAASSIATTPTGTSFFSRRNATIWLPDLWVQLRYRKFRFEAEGAAVLGSEDSDQNGIESKTFTIPDNNLARKFRQFGFATELEQKLVEDKLRLEFQFGWASGDSSAFNPDSTNNLVPAANQTEINSDTISTFRFNPAYRVDLILFRNLLQRVQGTYYFKPSVEYDFMRKPSGQRLGGGAGVVWSRASEFVQAPGHARDLGVELDGRLYFQSKDGGLNDHPDKMGGFYAMLEYGVLFPLAGLDYLPAQKTALQGAGQSSSTSAAQIMRLYLGVMF